MIKMVIEVLNIGRCSRRFDKEAEGSAFAVCAVHLTACQVIYVKRALYFNWKDLTSIRPPMRSHSFLETKSPSPDPPNTLCEF